MQEFIVEESGENLGFSINQPRKSKKQEKSVSHFVIETGDLSITETNSFGPVSSDSFKTTTTFSFSGSKKVYAAFHGKLLIQPNAVNSSLVNLILKPFKQPMSTLAIKYIVYRGIKKSSFFNGEALTGSASSGSELLRSLWTEFNNFNSQTGNSTPAFSADMIGFPTASKPQNDLSVLIDHFFFKESIPTVDPGTEIPEEPIDKAFELPMAQRGMEIGLAENSLGIDVVLDLGDFYYDGNSPLPLNLEYARSSSHTIECGSGMSAFEKKILREECTRFIDYVSFCGLHSTGTGRIYIDEESSPKKTKEEIAQLLNGFHTASRQYLFIQSNRQRSYNFYSNYDYSGFGNFQIAMAGETLTETNFGSQLWPVHIIDPGSSSETVLQMKLLADYDRNGCLLYVTNGSLIDSEYPDKITDSDLRLNDSEISGIDFTDLVKFQLSYSENDQVFISGIISLIYSGIQLNTFPFLVDDDDTRYAFKSFLFELFESPNLIPLTSSHDLSLVSSYKKSIVQIPSYDPWSVIILNQVVVDTGFIVDEENQITDSEPRILFISQLSQNESLHQSKTLSIPINYEGDILLEKSRTIYGKDNSLIQYHTINEAQNFQCISFVPSSGISSNYAHLGLTVTELTDLKSMIPANASNCKFHLEQVFDEELETTEKFGVMKFKLGVSFENFLGELDQVFNLNELFVFGLTTSFLSSKNYSTFI